MPHRPAAKRPKRTRRTQDEADEIAEIEGQLQSPLSSTDPDAENWTLTRSFAGLPISSYTKEALQEHKFVTLTAIQRAALPLGLRDKDVLGAAKTGSGKTLAFLLPVVEKLYRLCWSRFDGLGALIVSPTRELALQIFDELRKVGARHDLSAGLLIGGKSLAEEKLHVNGINILVCTPGRLLQHMDETPGFDCSQLQCLVLDEADRILDLGFASTMDAIIENLPTTRQTMLFSATQTKRVKDLARLSLRDPEYVAVHAEAEAPTPLKLRQAYVECELHRKLDLLWAFIKQHLRSRTLVFVSTCKQAKLLFEVMRRLRPGAPLRCLHGKMKQMKRMAIFYEFGQAQGGMVLIATDIAARGLDFPSVDWVLQLDCPEDVPAYIHRVGRTARYTQDGRGLLVLLPSEREAMVKLLTEAKIPIQATKVNPSKTGQSLTPALQALLSKSPELKDVAQRAMVAYLRSVFLQPCKAVFSVSALPVEDFAHSLGLSSLPRLRFLKRGPAQLLPGGPTGPTQTPQEAPQAAPPAPGAAPAGDHAQRLSSVPARSAGTIVGTSGGAAAGSRSAPTGQPPEEEGDLAAWRRSHTSAPAAGGVSKLTPEGGDAAGQGAGDDVDSQDEFVVRKRGVGVEAAGDLGPSRQREAEEASRGEAAGAQARPPKRRRLRIAAGRATGSRVVFDDQGLEQAPLEQLGSRLDDQSHGTEDAEAEDAAARFARLERLMRKHDAADKKALQRMRKEAAAAKKQARKQQAADESAGPILAPASDESDGASDASSDIDKAGPVIHKDPSHVGMGGRLAAQKPKPGLTSSTGLQVMTLAEQERMALRLLGRHTS